MAAIIGQNCTIYLEFPDGRVMELPGMTAMSVSLGSEMEDFCTYEMDFVQTRRLNTEISISGYFDGDFNEILNGVSRNVDIEECKSSPEWQCNYCGGINLREHRKCENCGASRSFVYG